MPRPSEIEVQELIILLFSVPSDFNLFSNIPLAPFIYFLGPVGLCNVPQPPRLSFNLPIAEKSFPNE